MAERLTKTERLGLIEAARLDANGTASMWDETTMALEATLQALEAEVERHRDAAIGIGGLADQLGMPAGTHPGTLVAMVAGLQARSRRRVRGAQLPAEGEMGFIHTYYEVVYWRDGFDPEESFDEDHGDLNRRTFGSLELARDESQLLESGGYNTRLFRVTRVEVA